MADRFFFLRAMYGIENLLLNDGSVYWYVEKEKRVYEWMKLNGSELL